MAKSAAASFLLFFSGLALLPYAHAQNTAELVESEASDKDVCAYLKDVEAAAEEKCSQEALRTLRSQDPSGYSRKLDLARKRKTDVLRAYEFLKAHSSSDAPDRKTGLDVDKADQLARIQLQPPINERTFEAWVGIDAKDLNEVYARLLQIRNQELQQEKKNAVSPQRREEIESVLASNNARISYLQKIKDPAELVCFLEGLCAPRPALSNPLGSGAAAHDGTWTKADFERANAEAARQTPVPPGRLNGEVPDPVAGDILRPTPRAPYWPWPAGLALTGLGAAWGIKKKLDSEGLTGPLAMTSLGVALLGVSTMFPPSAPLATPEGLVLVAPSLAQAATATIGAAVTAQGVMSTAQVSLSRAQASGSGESGDNKKAGEPSETEKADRTVNDIIKNPKSLSGKSPQDIESSVRAAKNWKIETLRQGSREGEGWVLREYGENGQPTGRVVRWHPGGGHHGPDPYWKVSSPGGGVTGEIR